MRRLAASLLLALAGSFLITTPASAEDPVITSMDVALPDRITVGDRITYTLNIESDPGIEFSVVQSSLPGIVELVDLPVISSLPAGDGRTLITMTFLLAAFAPGEGAAAYGAAKAAIVHYARNAANELSRHGITANYINADAVDTPLFRSLVKERAESRGETEEATLARYAERSIFRTATVPPEAVADAALWLASDASAYTSGCVITVGGGAEAMPR